MTKLPLVLVVDDEEPIRRFVREGLKEKGFACEDVGSAEGALLLAASLNPDAIVLDLGLPDGDGKDVVAELRHRGSTPIVVISARDQETEKVAALDAGADDYVTKPFGIDELAARLRVCLRHSLSERHPPAAPQTFGNLSWAPENQSVFLEGKEVHLTALEYRLFAYLAAHPARVLTHGVLLKEVWGLSSLEFSHYVRIAVASLRRKIEPTGSREKHIRTEIGVGYRFVMT